jgi:hypothetical protein
MRLNNNQQAFFALVKAGLWEQEVRLLPYGKVDYSELMRFSEEQSVVGLVAAGLEHLTDVRASKEDVLQFVGQTLQLEQKNLAMNEFVSRLIEGLRREGVYAILVKGQGIAQCYERPLWRASGDVDLLLSDTNYEKAKEVLTPQVVDVKREFKTFKHLGMTMKDGFVVELHGTLHSRLSRRMDRVIDDAQKDVLYVGNVRTWQNGETKVSLPAPDNDVIFVFTHILNHFYIGGIGLRQICDWCRLLWTYHSELDVRLLEQRLLKAGLMSEWKAFAALAVGWLGMPVEAMPLHSPEKKWSRKAERIITFVLECGNFGHNRQVTAKGKLASAWRKMKDFACHTTVFPLDSFKFFCHFFVDGVKLAFSK